MKPGRPMAVRKKWLFSYTDEFPGTPRPNQHLRQAFLFDASKNLVATFPSKRECAKFIGTTDNRLNAAMKKGGLLNGEWFVSSTDKPYDAPLKPYIYVFNMDGGLVAQYHTRAGVAKHVGVTNQRITQVLQKDGGICAGFIVTYDPTFPSHRLKVNKGGGSNKKTDGPTIKVMVRTWEFQGSYSSSSDLGQVIGAGSKTLRYMMDNGGVYKGLWKASIETGMINCYKALWEVYETFPNYHDAALKLGTTVQKIRQAVKSGTVLMKRYRAGIVPESTMAPVSVHQSSRFC